MAGKYYAVRKGRKTGVFSNWIDCKENVTGYKGAEYKSFKTLDEAKDYLNVDCRKEERDLDELLAGLYAYAFVDGSFNAKTKIYSYGVVLNVNGKTEEFSGSGDNAEFAKSRNVAGEVSGCIEAIRRAIDLKAEKLSIFYDYTGIRCWAVGEWKSNILLTREYVDFIDSVRDKISLDFRKVAAHTGVELNERADILAKKACGLSV